MLNIIYRDFTFAHNNTNKSISRKFSLNSSSIVLLTSLCLLIFARRLIFRCARLRFCRLFVVVSAHQPGENLVEEVPTPESILLMGTIASEEKQKNKNGGRGEYLERPVDLDPI